MEKIITKLQKSEYLKAKQEMQPKQQPLSTRSNRAAAADAAAHRHPQRRGHQSQESQNPLISHAAAAACSQVLRPATR